MMFKIGLGTAAIGRPQYINIRTESYNNRDLDVFKTNGLNILETAYQSGVRYFDTAPGYGMAEDLISEWARSTGYDDIEIATKWGYKYMADFNPSATVHEVKEHSLTLLNEQWHNSNSILTNISTLQVHSATFDTGVLDDISILERLNEIKNKHGIMIGLTTTGENQTEVLKYALEIEFGGGPLFEVFQVTYNILDQSLINIIDSLNGRRIIIKEALANGRLLPNSRYSNYDEIYRMITDLAEKYNTTVDTIALRFCLDSIDPFTVLSGVSNEQHLIQNLHAKTFQLSDKDVTNLKSYKVNPRAYWNERKQLSWN